MLEPPRLIAFYLPQFYPIPENDQWWGVGFTEWTNVARARPQFPGHYQPRLPTNLGFYDLRVPETRQAQADLARRHGVHGFCYYHYWFSGRRLLNRPFGEVLASGKPDFPFCLCWANHNWTRVWDGGEKQILMPQTYSADDDIRHIEALAPAMSDPRYIRVDGRPLFLVHRASEMPDPRGFADRWRDRAAKLGLGGLCLARVENTRADFVDPAQQGFDVGVEFHPRTGSMGRPMHAQPWRYRRGPAALVARLRHGHKMYDYGTIADLAMRLPDPPYARFPSVMVCWDNTARRKRDAVIMADSTPAHYERWLAHAIARAQAKNGGGVVFINAWNEWAEGNYLEPDELHGLAYLEATQRALAVTSTASSTRAD